MANNDDKSGPALLDELKAAAFEALLLNPGSGYGEWSETMMRQYATEVADVYGNDPKLSEIWESGYTDHASGISLTIKQWARAFATEEAREIYYELLRHVLPDKN